jgi:sarcosine oxidase subunit beta
MNALPNKAAVTIVGGGIHGLMLAFCLAERGQKDIVVLDAGYWQGGASGRNGTLVRGGFASPEWTRFFAHSLDLWIGLSKRLGENVMFTRRGYAVVAETEQSLGVLETMIATHRSCGVRSELLDRARIDRVLPAADRSRIRGVLYFDNAGTAPHHAAMKGLRRACERRGVRLFYQTAVTGFERQGDRIAGVVCGEHRISSDLTFIACGAQNIDVARLAGVDLEGHVMKIEAMASEPLRRVIEPGIALIDRYTYLHQTGRGEIVGGAEIEGETPQRGLANTIPIMAAYARHLVTMFPSLASLRILRHWTGMLHVAPDHGPIMGPHPDVRDLWFSAGWMYGIAGAPAAGRLLAKAIMTGEIDERIRPFAVDRFRRGALVRESSTVNTD